MQNVILFVDIRGFSKWSEAPEVFEFSDQFVIAFYQILNRCFPHAALIKALGDGAMIVYEMGEAPQVKGVLKEQLNHIQNAEQEFHALCVDFANRRGCKTDLRLGWGLVRGIARKLNGDYIGGNVNKASRLCSIARPFGVVIERDDFIGLEENLPFHLIPQVRKLEGMSELVNVWVTPEIATQFIPREQIRETPEVHIAGVCIKLSPIKDNPPLDPRGLEKGGLTFNDLRILIAKRNAERKLYPNLYEGCGGQLAYSESFVDGVKRHFRLELGIEVEVIEDIHKFYQIAEPNEPLIQGIRFLCLHKKGGPKSQNHSKIRWVTAEQLQQIDAEEFIPGLKADFLLLLEKYLDWSRSQAKAL